MKSKHFVKKWRKKKPKKSKKSTSWDGKDGYMKTGSDSVVHKYDKYHNHKGEATEEEIKKFWI